MEPIVNRVAQSGIEVFDLEQFFHEQEFVALDLTPFLFKGLILKEKEFRQAVRDADFSEYGGRHVHIICSADTLVPPWSYMLIAATLEDVAASVVVGEAEAAKLVHLSRSLDGFDWSMYEDKIVVVKGCGAHNVPESAYALAMTALQGVARKVMYGEPCSSVPIWRKRAKAQNA